MSEPMGFAEAVWTCLKEEFQAAAACAAVVAEAMGDDANKVANALYAMSKRHAVIEAGTDEQGRMLYKANLNAKFRRPRADKGAPPPKGKRKPKKKATGTTAVAARAAAPASAVELEPGAHFAVDGTWHVLVRDGTSSVRIAPAIALAMRDWLDQLSPALEAAQ